MKNLKKMFFLLIQFVVISGRVTGDNCATYKEIPEAKYNRDPNSIKNSTSRPLGFDSATIVYVNNNPTAKNPCFKVLLNDSSRQTVEVLAHSTIGNSKICVRSEPSYTEPTCQSGVKTCHGSPVLYSEVKYVFYCEGCESDVSFWFRFTVSPSFTDPVELENWCARGSEYPDSLIHVPNPSSTSVKPSSRGCISSPTMMRILIVLSTFLTTLTHF